MKDQADLRAGGVTNNCEASRVCSHELSSPKFPCWFCVEGGAELFGRKASFFNSVAILVRKV